MRKIDMARYICAALSRSGELPSVDNPMVKKVARYKERRLIREYEAAVHVLKQRKQQAAKDIYNRDDANGEIRN